MQASDRTFFGKIMLFGEYSVICQGRALTIPLYRFQSGLRFPSQEYEPLQSKLNQQLKDYLLALVRQEEKEGKSCGIDLNLFALDLLRGMFLESDIPPGYGAGSSGALVAAVYQRYACRHFSDEELQRPRKLIRLQNIMARLEAYFHGTSSGIDPLSCFLGKPLLIDPENGPAVTKLPKLEFRKSGGFFLADTMLPRSTETLVEAFLAKCKDFQYQSLIENVYKPLVDFCIEAVLSANIPELLRGFRHLSSMQMQHFPEAIPPGFDKIWNEGLENGYFYLKLCGAGGGGFLLGLTEDYDYASVLLNKAGLKLLPLVTTN